MMNQITATTTSKMRTNLTSYLKDVTTNDLEVHIVTQTGKNAVLISETQLNKLREELKTLQDQQTKQQRIAYLTDSTTKKYTVAEDMHQDILGDLYDQLPE